MFTSSQPSNWPPQIERTDTFPVIWCKRCGYTVPMPLPDINFVLPHEAGRREAP